MMSRPLRWTLLISAVVVASTSVRGQVQYVPTVDASGHYRWKYPDSKGQQQEFVFVPATQVRPTVSVDIATTQGGLRKYTYTIANEPTAKQAIQGCMVDIAIPTTIEGTPGGWEAPIAPTEIVPRASWFTLRGEAGIRGIAAGQQVSGFQLQSAALPGVVEFRCRGSVARPSYPDDLPEDIELQVVKLSAMDRVVVRTLGPAIERPEDPVPVVLRRIVRHYRTESLRNEAVQNAAVVQALDRAIAINMNDHSALRAAVLEIRRLLSSAPESPRDRELMRGLGLAIDDLVRRLPQP